jgi:hypothetical protein
MAYPFHESHEPCGLSRVASSRNGGRCRLSHFTFSKSPGFQLLFIAASVGP